MEYSEKWGKDENEAIRLAMADLKLSMDDQDKVNIEILEESSKGFFGIGSKLAKVRVELKSKEKNQKNKKEKKESKDNKYKKSSVENKQKEKIEKNDETELKKMTKTVKEEKIKVDALEDEGERKPIESTPCLDFIKGLTEKMGLDVEIKAEETDISLYIYVSGKDSGTVIGKRGQTLDSIQYLVRLVAIKEKEKYKRVIVDAEDYRAKREKTLEELANRLATKVIRSRRSFKLEPMSPYERKIIHGTLQSNEKVVTRSEGEEPYRKVVIDLKR